MGALTIKPYAYEFRSWELSKRLVPNLVSIYPEFVYLQAKDNNPLRIIPQNNLEFITNTLRFGVSTYSNSSLQEFTSENLFSFGFSMNEKKEVSESSFLLFNTFLNLYTGLDITQCVSTADESQFTVMLKKNTIKYYSEVVYYLKNSPVLNGFNLVYWFLLYKCPVVLCADINLMPLLFVSSMRLTTLLSCWEVDKPTQLVSSFNKKYAK